MAIGMGTVFAFLGLMVLAMNTSSYVIRRFFPPEPEPVKSQASVTNPEAEIAIVLAAANRWRQEHGGN